MKKLGIKHALIAGLAGIALFTTQATPATAATAGVLVVDGGGTIAPGLGATPPGTVQNFTFSSVAITSLGVVNNNPSVLGVSNCNASGTSLVPETLAGGAGQGTVQCISGPLNGLKGNLTYVREGASVTVAIQATAGGTGGAALGCVFIASTTPPGTVTNYSLRCVGGGALAP